MNYHKECLYCVEWQKLRCLMLGKWSSAGGIKQALKMANGYWEPPADDKAERVWRVLNLLNAVKLGWSQNPVAMPKDGEADLLAVQSVHLLAERLSRLHAKFTDVMGTQWDWNKVRKDLQYLDPRALRAIQSNLNKRVASARYRRGEDNNSGVESRRPELMFFIGLLNIEQNRRNKVPNRCLAKVTAKESPYMGEFRGYRIQVATPNWAGRKPFTNDRAPSFDKPYNIVTYGDFEDEEALEKARVRAVHELNGMGFSDIVWME